MDSVLHADQGHSNHLGRWGLGWTHTFFLPKMVITYAIRPACCERDEYVCYSHELLDKHTLPYHLNHLTLMWHCHIASVTRSGNGRSSSANPLSDWTTIIVCYGLADHLAYYICSCELIIKVGHGLCSAMARVNRKVLGTCNLGSGGWTVTVCWDM